MKLLEDNSTHLEDMVPCDDGKNFGARDSFRVESLANLMASIRSCLGREFELWPLIPQISSRILLFSHQ